MVRDSIVRDAAKPDRRAVDFELGERMAKIEARIEGAEDGITRTESAIVRVHERIDDLVKTVSEVFAGVDKDVSSIVNRSLNSHIKDEEKVLAARFETMQTQFNSLNRKLDSVAMDAAERGDSASKHLEELRRMGLSAILAAGTVLTGIAGFVISFLVDHGPKILSLIHKMESMP